MLYGPGGDGGKGLPGVMGCEMMCVCVVWNCTQERVRQLAAELQTISAEFGELRAEHASVQVGGTAFAQKALVSGPYRRVAQLEIPYCALHSVQHGSY